MDEASEGGEVGEVRLNMTVQKLASRKAKTRMFVSTLPNGEQELNPRHLCCLLKTTIRSNFAILSNV